MRTSPVKGGEKTLTKQEFDALFERCKARCLPSDQGQIQESGPARRLLTESSPYAAVTPRPIRRMWAALGWT